MNLPQTDAQPDDPDRLPPARRRRARRLLAPFDSDERAALLDEIAHRASPSFQFFLFSLLAGLVIASGFYLDEPAILVLGAVLAPFMAPVVGISLGTVIGSGRYFFRSLAGLLVGGLLVFGTGLVAGYLARGRLLNDLSQAHLHTQLSWPDFALLAAGAVLTAVLIGPPNRRPEAPSVALAYELYLPLVAAGLGLGSGEPFLFPDGLVVFAMHLAWAALLGALTLAILGYRPLTLFGYTLGAAVALTGVILLIGISGAGAAFGAQIGLPTPIPSPTPTHTLTPTPTHTPIPPTATQTPTLTPTMTPTPTTTPSPTPTPVLVVVFAPQGEGAFVRAEPGGEILTVLSNDTVVQLLPERSEFEGISWVQVITAEGIRGWMVETLLVTPTPASP